MTAFNVIRVRVKPGREDDFNEAHRRMRTEDFPAFRRGVLVKTGERAYCVVGEWESIEALVAARPQMLSFTASRSSWTQSRRRHTPTMRVRWTA